MTATRSASLRLGGSMPSQLPLNHPRPPGQTFAGATIPLAITHATVDGLRRAALGAGGTLSDALAAAYAWWLHLYADSTDVIFGSAEDPRYGDDLTPLAVRCDVSGEEPFTALVGRIRRAVTEALSDVVRDAVRSTKFDISVELDERSDGQVVGGFAYSADLFDRATASEMASHWCRLLDAVAAEPAMPMAEHDLVTPEERQRQLSWNRTSAEGISSQCVHELISSQVERTPDAIAVAVGNTTLTYRQLDDRAAVIASWLAQAGAGPGVVVALLLDRTPDVVAAILGVLKSGAAFLPLDPRQPDARNTFCINDVGANIVLTDRALPVGADAITAAVVNLGDLEPHAPGNGAAPSAGIVSPADLAYVICTSGSTGRPKPVLIEHRGVTNLTRNLVSEFGIGAGDTVLSVASISFDMALFDIFSALVCGARLVLASTAEAVIPASLNRLIAPRGATYMFTTPTIWGTLIAAGWRGDRRLKAAAGARRSPAGWLRRCCNGAARYGTDMAPPKRRPAPAWRGCPRETPLPWADPSRMCGCTSPIPGGVSNRSGFPARSPSVA